MLLAVMLRDFLSNHWICCCACENETAFSNGNVNVISQPALALSQPAVPKTDGPLPGVSPSEAASSSSSVVPKLYGSLPPPSEPVLQTPVLQTPVLGNKTNDKLRWQKMMTEFVQNASRGVPCIYLKEKPQESEYERFTTQYFLDKDLHHFVIVAADNTAVAEVRCPIIGIQELS